MASFGLFYGYRAAMRLPLSNVTIEYGFSIHHNLRMQIFRNGRNPRLAEQHRLKQPEKRS